MNLKNLWTIWSENNLTGERVDACAIEDNFGAKFSFGEMSDEVVRYSRALEKLCPNRETVMYYGTTCTALQFLRWAAIKNGNPINFINIDCQIDDLINEVQKEGIKTIFVVEPWLSGLLGAMDALKCENLVLIRPDEYLGNQTKSYLGLPETVASSSAKVFTVNDFLTLSLGVEETETYMPLDEDRTIVFRTGGTSGKSKAVKIGYKGCLNMYEKYAHEERCSEARH